MNTNTFTRSVLLSLSLAVAGVAYADLDDDMEALAKQYRAFNHAENAAQATQALNAMRQAAVSARGQTPDKLENKPANSPQIRDYRAGMDALITQIDTVKALAASGQLPQAKTAGKQLGIIRDENHKKFR